MAKRAREQKGDQPRAEKRPRIESQEKSTVACNELGPRNPKACLFGIEGEVQNLIYTFALVEDEPITLNTINHKQPGLLRACKKTRSEGMSIFMKDNIFCLEVIHLKPMVPIRSTGFWLHKYFGVKLSLQFYGRPDRSNFKKWLRGFYAGEYSGIDTLSKTSGPSARFDALPWEELLVAAFDLGARMKREGKSLRELEAHFPFFEGVVSAAAKDWVRSRD